MTTANEIESCPLPADEFLALVRNAPLVSIDLIVENNNGEVLVGRRKNSPAKGSWFVPGGRVQKDETLDVAFARITCEEFGAKIPRVKADFLGVFEHFYPDNFAGVSSVGTHYVVLSFRLGAREVPDAFPTRQHSEFRWMSLKDAVDNQEVHPNTREYFATSTRSSTEVLIGLYNVYQTALSYYPNVIWVFPAAFLTLNVTAWNYLQGREHRWSLLVVALANLLFTQAFFKLVANERAIINVLQPLEATLRARVGASVVPNFESGYNRFTRIKSADAFKIGIAAIAALVMANGICQFF
jgi:colanic acid biosynthesis protein WcaH